MYSSGNKAEFSKLFIPIVCFLTAKIITAENNQSLVVLILSCAHGIHLTEKKWYMSKTIEGGKQANVSMKEHYDGICDQYTLL